MMPQTFVCIETAHWYRYFLLFCWPECDSALLCSFPLQGLSLTHKKIISWPFSESLHETYFDIIEIIINNVMYK